MRKTPYISLETIHEKWKTKLSEKRQEGEIYSLYIDNPFCLKFCDFCMYTPTLLENKYVNNFKDYYYDILLHNQIKDFSPIIEKASFDTVYFGGGTSSIMSELQMRNLFTQLQSHFDFKHVPKEKTFELNPLSITREKIQLLCDWNFTHVTMGVQSFHKEVLKKNDRVNLSLEKMQDIFGLLQKHNIQINIDIMVFIYQDDDKEDISLLLKDIHTAMNSLRPNRITIYPNSFKLLDLKLKYKHFSPEKSLSLVFKKMLLLRKALKSINHPEYDNLLIEDVITIANHKKNYFFVKKGDYIPYMYNCTDWSEEESHWVKNQNVLSLGGFGKREPFSYIGESFCYHTIIDTNTIKYKLIYPL